MRVQRALQASSCAKQLAGSLCRHSAFRSPHWASWVLFLLVTPAHGPPRALHSVLTGQGGLGGREVWARATKPHPDLKRPLYFVSTQPCVTFAHRLSLTCPKRPVPVFFSLSSGLQDPANPMAKLSMGPIAGPPSQFFR